MAINSTQEMEPGDLYTTDGKDIWEVESFCDEPTVTMINVRTGKKVGGAIGCLNLEKFKKTRLSIIEKEAIKKD